MPADLNDYFKKKNGGGGSGDNDNRTPLNVEPPEFLKNLGKKAGLLYVLIGLVVIFVSLNLL